MAALGLVFDERERGAIRVSGLRTAVESAQQLRTRHRQQMVFSELALPREVVHHTEPAFDGTRHRDRDRVVERDHG